MDLTRMCTGALLERLLSQACEASAVRATASLPTEVTMQDQRVRLMLDTARELLLRELHRALQGQALMDRPSALREWLRLQCGSLEHEVFLVVFLDAHYRIITAKELFRGSLTQTTIYPREVVKEALAHNAAAVAFAHNHPSGEAEPSRADEHITSTL